VEEEEMPGWKRGRLSAALALIAGLGLSAGAVAIAGDDNDGGSGRPQTDEVTATVDFTHFEGRFRGCTGEDGEYTEAHVTVTGTSTGDSRLTGEVEARVHFLDLEVGPEAVIGTNRGRFIVRDPATGKKKVDAHIYAVTKNEETLKGFMRGKVNDEGVPPEPTAGAGELFANFRVLVVEVPGDPGFDFEGQIGGTGSEQMPAVIQSGRCSGPFERSETDLPSDEAAAAARALGGPSGWGGLGK
jgi:hypothetical protein